MSYSSQFQLLLVVLGVLIRPGPLEAQLTPTRLSSGVAVTRTLGPVSTSTLYTGDFGFVISVPANATRLDITLSSQPATTDVDLFARFGQAVNLVNQQIVFDHSSTGDAGDETITIPAPQQGDHHIALALYTNGIAVSCTIRATVTQPTGSPLPVLPSIGVLNAADNTPNFAPGTILSLYGANLASGTLAASLPMPATLLGTSVEVQVNGRVYPAPLFFVSASQINAQLPYEAVGSGVQIRVRNTAGTTDWVTINVAARAPRILTVNMSGSGAPILQHHSDYKVVSAEYPAKPGEIVTLYLLGLGATSPAIASGAIAGDGSEGNPLNTVPGVTVKVGDETAELFFAGLTPYLIGLYQVDFRMPPGAVAGILPISVSVGQVTSQANVKASCGDRESQLLNIGNPAACNTTATSSFTLEREAFVTRFTTWYRWNTGETSVAFTLRKAGQQVMQANFQRGSCDPNQSSWCAGEALVNQWWAAGLYELTVSQPRVCANSGSANQGFVSVFGVWKAGGIGAVVSSTIGPAGGSLANAGLSVTVPAGTFNQPTVLNLSQASDSTPPAAGRVSEIYRLEPLPGSVSAPITLSIQPVGAIPATGKTFVFVKFEGEDDRGPMILNATTEAGRIVATLPAMPAGSVVPTANSKPGTTNSAVVDPSRLASLIWALGGISEMKSPSGKFIIHFPTGDIADYDLAIKVGETMDEARTKLEAIGIEVNRRSTPIDVYLYSFSGTQGRVLMADPDTNGESETELWGKQGIGLSLNLDQIKGAGTAWENARTTAAHELFHVYQSLYDPRGYWRRSFSNSPWLWMMEAASTWFEKKMVSGKPYLSNNAKAYNDFFYLHGLEYAPGYLDKKTVTRHGYGASLFLDYITTLKTDRFIGDVFREMEPSTGLIMKASIYSPVEAMIRQDMFLGSKWPDFFTQLAAAKVNPGISINDLVSPQNTKLETYSNRDDSEVVTRFNWSAPDLSARGYRISFVPRTTKWSIGTKLVFSLSGAGADTTAYVFKAEAGAGWVYKGSVKPSLEITQAEALARDGGQFFVIIAHGRAQRPFATMTSLSLEMRVDVKLAETPVQKADVLFEVFRLYKSPVGSSNQMCNDYSISITDPKGVMIESGSSVARNGAYDTRLIVGDGYSYAIRYNYTIPCRDSGNASGRFNVKPNVINSVRVETPRCETN